MAHYPSWDGAAGEWAKEQAVGTGWRDACGGRMLPASAHSRGSWVGLTCPDTLAASPCGSHALKLHLLSPGPAGERQVLGFHLPHVSAHVSPHNNDSA